MQGLFSLDFGFDFGQLGLALGCLVGFGGFGSLLCGFLG